MEQLVVDTAIAGVVRAEQPLETVRTARMAGRRDRTRSLLRSGVLKASRALRDGRMQDCMQLTQPRGQHQKHEKAPAGRAAAQQAGSVVNRGCAEGHRMRAGGPQAAQAPILAERRGRATVTATLRAPAVSRSAPGAYVLRCCANVLRNFSTFGPTTKAQ